MGTGKKVLVLGAKGMLGHDLMDILPRGFDASGVDIDELDITDAESTARCIGNRRPFAVINAAARTDVDGCEGDSQGAFAVNAVGAENVALACLETGARLLQLSTDYVFDGMKGKPYGEDDAPNPRSVYGKSKLAGEEAVKTILRDFLIIRTSWLFGRNGKNFVDTILRASRNRGKLEVVGDQYGSPTYTRDLARAISRLLSTEYMGIINVTNSGSCSWCDYARAILDLAGVKGVEVEETKSDRLSRPAPRPPFSVLDGSLYVKIAGSPLRYWREAVREYLLTGNS